MEEKIIDLLLDREAAMEKRVAAAIVLGEVGANSTRVAVALGEVLDSDAPLLQQRALESLSRVGAKRSIPKIIPLFASPSEEVRRAARAAVSSFGEGVVGTLRERLAGPEERAEAVELAADAASELTFSALLRGLASATGDAAGSAALVVKQRVKDADSRTRKTYLAETEKLLAAQAKARGTSAALAGTIRVLGTLEDPRTLPTLLSYATSKTADALVKKEAIRAVASALRGDRAPPKVVDALATAAVNAEDRSLAQAALETLDGLALAPESIRRLSRLLASPDPEHVRFVIDLLARAPGGDAAKLLVEVLARLDRSFAEPAASALEGKADAAPALARALLETQDRDRAWTLSAVLRPLAKQLPLGLRKELLGHAIDRLASGERGWEAALDVARDADPEAVASALRATAHKLVRARSVDKAQVVLSLLTKAELCTPEDRYLQASLTLQRSALDTEEGARQAEDLLGAFERLAEEGFDVSRALRKDRNLDLEHIYYVGCHLADAGLPAGRELLDDVRARGGRARVARLAKAKLEAISIE